VLRIYPSNTADPEAAKRPDAARTMVSVAPAPKKIKYNLSAWIAVRGLAALKASKSE
jgi:hypothetical protein